METRPALLWLPVAAAALLLSPAALAVNIDWVTVGDPGNACDVQVEGCFGSLSYAYQIGKYEVTNAQYAEFLNAVGATDTNALYSTNMADGTWAGITRNGSSGSFTYSLIARWADKPVNYVSIWDTLRFANWMHNGQPAGAQGTTTTEDGAYTLTPDGMANNSITRNAGATIFLTSEDEWYKAAYYDAGTGSYFDYPTASDTPTICTTPGATPNTANCYYWAVGNVTDVGSYTGSAGPAGTFDQGGNIAEWNEVINGSYRGVRGGNFSDNDAFRSAASFRGQTFTANEDNRLGFRVASIVPEPGTALLALTGLQGLAGSRKRGSSV